MNVARRQIATARGKRIEPAPLNAPPRLLQSQVSRPLPLPDEPLGGPRRGLLGRLLGRS